MTNATRAGGAIAAVCLLAATACSSDGLETTSESAPTAAPTTAVADESDEPTTTEPPETAPTSTAASTTAPPSTTEPEADAPAVTTTTITTTTTTASDASPMPPEAGEPNTVNIVFEDGERGTAPVRCDSDPDQEFFKLSFKSGPEERRRFELQFFDSGEVAEWRTEDEIWLVSATQGSITMVGDRHRSPISGTGVLLKADLSDGGEVQFTSPSGGEPLTTGEERVAAFTIVCAEFGGGRQPLSDTIKVPFYNIDDGIPAGWTCSDVIPGFNVSFTDENGGSTIVEARYESDFLTTDEVVNATCTEGLVDGKPALFYAAVLDAPAAETYASIEVRYPFTDTAGGSDRFDTVFEMVTRAEAEAGLGVGGDGPLDRSEIENFPLPD